MSVIRQAPSSLYRAVAGPSRLAMSASVARPLTPSAQPNVHAAKASVHTATATRRPFSPTKQLLQKQPQAKQGLQQQPAAVQPAQQLQQQQLQQLRTITTTPPVKRQQRVAWAANPIVEYDEIKPLTQQPTDDILIIDVREPDEVALGTLPSAVNLPLSRLDDVLAPTYNPAAFKKEFAFQKPAASQKIIFYCRSGKRSASAAELAGKHGYPNIRNYVGSWLEWSEKEGVNLLAA